jgi:hypothetical protein
MGRVLSRYAELERGLFTSRIESFPQMNRIVKTGLNGMTHEVFCYQKSNGGR